MTNADFDRGYSAAFAKYLLVNVGTIPTATILAGSQKAPKPGDSCFAYVPQIDDFIEVPENAIVAIIRVKSLKSKI